MNKTKTFIHRYNNEIVLISVQSIGYALKLPSQYLLKYLPHHRGVEILKCSTCPRASYLKKVTCPDKLLLVLFFCINI